MGVPPTPAAAGGLPGTQLPGLVAYIEEVGPRPPNFVLARVVRLPTPHTYPLELLDWDRKRLALMPDGSPSNESGHGIGVNSQTFAEAGHRVGWDWFRQ